MNRRLVWLGALLALALSARLGAGALSAFDGQVDDGRVVTSAGFEVATSVYTPRAVRHPGAVVLCHGISASRAHMDPMARALARRGHRVVSFDFGGHGRSQDRPGLEEHNVADVLAAVALARRRGGDGPLALVGHSMGVTSAAAASLRDAGVVCVVALGQRPFVTTARPRALLLADGTQDLFHPYANLRAVASEAAGHPVRALETAVDPETGAVRRLFLSGSCEHAGEVYDGAIIGELAAFVAAAQGPGGAPPPAEAEARAPLAVSLAFVSNAAALVALVVLGLALCQRLTPRRVAFALALAPVVCLGLARLLASPALGELAASLLLGVLVGGALVARRARGEPVAWRAVGAVCGVLLAGWIGGTLLGAAPAFWERPELLKGAPLYVWQGVAFRFEFSVQALAARLAVGNSWPTILGLLALLAVEVAWPGKLALVVAGFVGRLVGALGGRFGERSAAASATGRRKCVAAAALVVLLCVAGVLFFKRSQEGLLAEEGALGTVASAGLRMLVLPVVAAAAALWLGRGARRLYELVLGAQDDEPLQGEVGGGDEGDEDVEGRGAAAAAAELGQAGEDSESPDGGAQGGEDDREDAGPGATR